MKQVVIISGKGGTGKTTIAASFISLAKNVVVSDCDVDAPNLHLLLNPKVKEKKEYKDSWLAEINQKKCMNCGICGQVCQFSAINDNTVDPILCEGCGVCEFMCPEKAIVMKEQVSGYSYVSETKYGPMTHALLEPGGENSGKLVTQIRQSAIKIAKETGRDLVLIDGPPGIGCPVIASVTETDVAVIVTEPSLSAIHDLKRAYKMTQHFKVPTVVMINKYDLNTTNTKRIIRFCSQNKIEVIGKVPFDDEVTRAMVKGVLLVESSNGKAAKAFRKAWLTLEEILNKGGG